MISRDKLVKLKYVNGKAKVKTNLTEKELIDVLHWLISHDIPFDEYSFEDIGSLKFKLKLNCSKGVNIKEYKRIELFVLCCVLW